MPRRRKERPEDVAEAERLTLLPRDVQRQILAMHRADAANPAIPQADRDDARQRVAALERLLRRLNRQRKNS